MDEKHWSCASNQKSLLVPRHGLLGRVVDRFGGASPRIARYTAARKRSTEFDSPADGASRAHRRGEESRTGLSGVQCSDERIPRRNFDIQARGREGLEPTEV